MIARKAECGHPERKHKARGMCSPCWQRARRSGQFSPKQIGRVNECGHPERQHQACGMCRPCYGRSPAVKAARLLARRARGILPRGRSNECGHPERRHKGHGMCNACLQAARARSRGVAVRSRRFVECGHTDRTHVARGMCGSCYQQADERRQIRSRDHYLAKKQDPEWYARMLANGRRYHRANRDAILERQKVWKADPVRKAHYAAYQRAYRAKQQLRPRYARLEYDCISGARNANNRARRNGNPGRITTADVREVMSDNVCALCGTEDQPSLDHVVPLSGGGVNVKANLQRLCLPCNSAKRDAIPLGVAA